MGILDNKKFALLICEMFYRKGMSQKEISAELNISRSQVCRILMMALESGLVTININYPNLEEGEYQRLISEKYGVKEVYVFDIGELSGDEAMKELAEKSKELFSVVVKDGERVGVMAGKTICELANSLTKSRNRNLEFVPLCGGTASSGTPWYANAIAQNFAEKTSGQYYIFNAPQYLASVESKNVLLAEPSIKEIMDLGKACDVALIGIGTASFNSTAIQAGNLAKDEVGRLKEEGAVASICASYINVKGEIVNSDLSERILGQSIPELSKTRKVGVARGKSKVEAIKAVLNGGHLDVLITSLDTAKLLV